MLTDGDRQWLRDIHPGLSVYNGFVEGTIEIKAAYDAPTDTFTILFPGDETEPVAGVVLSGQFDIRIQERTERRFSGLPAVYVNGVEPIAERHFAADGTACLCSPFEETELLVSNHNFRIFLEQLVIPFLYGQVFYSREKHWPWAEYAHGPTGLLEAYSRLADPERALECLEKLKLYTKLWPRIEEALQQRPYIKGHTRCFCTNGDLIRRCHPHALNGIQKLRRDLIGSGPDRLVSRSLHARK